MNASPLGDRSAVKSGPAETPIAARIQKLFDLTESRELLIESLQYGTKIGMFVWPETHSQLFRVYGSLSEGRKVFRLFKFVPEFAMIDLNDGTASICKHLCSAAFYLLDHYIWFEQVVRLRKDLAALKFLKHKFSFLSSVFGLFVSLRDLKTLLVPVPGKERPASSAARPSLRLLYNIFRILMSVVKLRVLKFPINPLYSGLLGLATALLGQLSKLNTC